MTRQEFLSMIEKRPLILDGATGTNLQKAGMPGGVCPELWILDHPDVILDLQKKYVEAGTDILYAPTFSGNRIKLGEYGVGDRIRQINMDLVRLAKEAAGGKALVAGDMTMTGESLAPVGSLEVETLIDIYKEQAGYLLEAGVDLFVVETMMSLAETRAAVIAIREICDLPIIASLTFQENGRTLYGTDPVTAVVVLQNLGADVVGVNCSTGPEEMLPLIREMREYAQVPLLAKPNAGLPVLIDEVTVYPMEPEEFASFGPDFVRAGAGLIGGCCGTRPEHIARLKESVEGMVTAPPDNRHPMVLSSERKIQEIDLEGRFLVIGERINPTGKKALQAELRAGKLDMVEQFALDQESMGAHILDVNMGTSGIDEKEMMIRAIDLLTMATDLPLCIDTSYVEVMEAALRRYPGRALINSISLEKEKIEKLLPMAKKYGAMFILLPLSDAGLPKSLSEKKEIILQILAKADELGISRNNIIVDGLVTTAGANKKAGLETLETIAWCRKELKLPTTVGLSNISFGLPERPYVNGAFAAMALSAGLTMAIANPSNRLLMGISFAADLLSNKEGADIAYIEQIERMGPAGGNVSSPVSPVPATSSGAAAPAGSSVYPDRAGSPGEISAGAAAQPLKGRDGNRDNAIKESGSHMSGQPHLPSRQADDLFQAVLKGSRNRMVPLIEDIMSSEEPPAPGQILDQILIPAINEVGRLFDCQKYFLPQLIASAKAMEQGVAYLEPMMEEARDEKSLPTIIIATVEGDIHDIGKNLVALMLRNYGYPVIDLGKDVPARKIIDAAKENHAAIITLSALMTTTMMRMKDTIELRDQELPGVRVMIGGAVTTPEFAREIGADGYSRDAADAVKLVEKLLDGIRKQ